MMVPVPGWPGFGAYPGAVRTTTILVMWPVIVLPFWEIEVETAVPMWAGTDATGEELLPGEVVQVPPQAGGLELGLSANPLNEVGALPPVRVLSPDHWAPQKVIFEGLA